MFEAIFTPKSVAVIGASPSPDRVGYAVLKNILDNGYPGAVYPINPHIPEILGYQAYASVLDVPDLIDLAVLVVPISQVLPVVKQCGQKGVRGLVVITAGFKEAGSEGNELERKLLALVRSYGMDMIGPNSLGVIDTFSKLNASFAGVMPNQGNIALMSQSGAICAAILDWSKNRGIGFSRFVSLGNKTDINEVTLLRAWSRDPESKVILAYLEDISDGASFIATAREVTRQVPVIAIKSGTTAAGSRAASSHTGSLAGSEHAYEAAFAQSGILRARTVSELFDLALIFSYQPLIQGNRVAVVTNSGGMGIIAADAVERSGLAMALFAPATIERLNHDLPPSASVYNPVDILGDARNNRYQTAITAVLEDPGVDGLIIMLTPQAQSALVEIAETIGETAARYKKPVVTCFMGGYSLGPALAALSRAHIPNYTFPERAVQSIAGMHHYYERRRRPQRIYRTFETDQDQVRQIFADAHASGRVELSEGEVRAVLSAYGLRLPESHLAMSPEEAVQQAAMLGFPVVMKIASPDILLKTEIGGVKLGITGEEAARDSFELIEYRTHKYWPEARVHGVFVQEMIKPGQEFLITVHRDPQFGPLVAIGLGGMYVEVMKDVAYRLAPISEQDVRDQIRSLRAYPLLRGAGGNAPVDVLAVEDCVLRVSQLVTDFTEIVELDINPLVIHHEGEGAVVLDARILIQ
ncbi:acetate--CoA ligase alpha subunit [Candidatus Chloroploca sp. Khr17]|uniref:acetate--CoA ligase alpha subunit n=1 Tax=Candidatus Chloroploca sp. Khr17 TaxID=2496869 RepID=UPI00101DC497|nr:acetate--CoA ligase [Candidatus Chloroploca sp. Khr17]